MRWLREHRRYARDQVFSLRSSSDVVFPAVSTNTGPAEQPPARAAAQPRKVECLKMGLFTLLNALPKGAFKEGGGGAAAAAAEPLDGGDGFDDGFEQQGISLAAAASGWTPALRECWVPHVASATRSQVG